MCKESQKMVGLNISVNSFIGQEEITSQIQNSNELYEQQQKKKMYGRHCNGVLKEINVNFFKCSFGGGRKEPKYQLT